MNDDPYFVVLPDAEAAFAVLRRLRDTDPRLDRIDHPSGRPWLVGRWAPGQLRHASAGGTAIATLGPCSAGPEDLRRRAQRLRDIDELTSVSAGWAGSFHLVAAAGGRIRVQGTAYGMRRVHHARIGGIVVAGDRAGVLARLAGAEVDAGALVAHLMFPLPHPLGERGVFGGVHPVPNGRYLSLAADGGAWTYRRWHRPPEPHLPLAEGAAGVREALSVAVSLRTAGEHPVSADLSGGLDSTSVAFLAAAQVPPGRLRLSTMADRLERNDDLRWADRAAAHLPGVAREVTHGADIPPFYAGCWDERDDFDQPTDTVVNRGRATATLRRMAALGSAVHLTGYGGDQLFLGQPAHFHTLAGRRPRLALQRLRGYRALFNWRRRDVLAALLDRRSYARAFAGIDLHDAAAMELSTVRLDWMYRPRIPPWLTDGGRELLAEAIAAAGPAEPLAPGRGRHLDLFGIDHGTRILRPLTDMARRAGVELHAPYCDDHVIDAALAVRAEDRTTPFAYKRLLAEAMRPVLPPPLLTRRTKGHATSMVPIGLRRYRTELIALFEGSELERAGLVDAARVRALCATPDAAAIADAGLDSTLGCEVWLRHAVARSAPGTRQETRVV